MATAFNRQLIGLHEDFLKSISVSPEQIAATEHPRKGSDDLLVAKNRKTAAKLRSDPDFIRKLNDRLAGRDN